MHRVSDEQVDFILSDIAKRGIETEDVKFNILDHVCCIIENEMPDGSDFMRFYERTISRFYKKELREIQEETNNLITFKYYYAMRRTLKISGGISIFLSILGAIFKAMHWPGAGVLIILSLFFFAFIFIPLNIVMKFKDQKATTNRFIMSFGFILGIFITTGFIFKLFHWPGANILMFGALALFSFVFIPVYFITHYRAEETRFNAIVNTTFMVAGAALFFAMISLRTSKNVDSSVRSLETSQANHITQIGLRSEGIYQDLKETSSSDTKNLKQATESLNGTILSIMANLIAKSNGISFEKAKSLGLKDVNNMNDDIVVRNEFTNANGEFSHKALVSAINDYNAKLEQLSPQSILQPLNPNSAMITETILSVVLIELTNIRARVYSNEYNFLCYQQGIARV